MPAKRTRVLRLCVQCGTGFMAKPSDIAKGGGKFCRWECHVMAVAVDPSVIADRFWLRVDQSSADGCWPWLGAKRSDEGYGGVWDGKRWAHSHRFAYELASGESVPSGMRVLHACDNPPCCRNDEPGFYEIGGILRPRWGHLWIGTNADNSLDMALKGRSRKGRKTPRDLVVVGERHPQSKVTADQVREIRRRYAAGGISQRLLGLEYGITQMTVTEIVRRKIWRHVD